METMTIPPASADMKRGAFGPSPARRNTLWNVRRARAAAQYCAEVSARNRETGEFVQVTANFGGEIVDGVLIPDRQGSEAIAIFQAARNRAACRAGHGVNERRFTIAEYGRGGHVNVGRYRAAREAEQEIPAPTCGGLIYGPPTPWSAEGRAMRVRRPVDVRHHTAQQAIDAILAGL